MEKSILSTFNVTCSFFSSLILVVVFFSLFSLSFSSSFLFDLLLFPNNSFSKSETEKEFNFNLSFIKSFLLKVLNLEGLFLFEDEINGLRLIVGTDFLFSYFFEFFSIFLTKYSFNNFIVFFFS